MSNERLIQIDGLIESETEQDMFSMQITQIMCTGLTVSLYFMILQVTVYES